MDYGMWINMLSHKLKKRMNAAVAEFGITGVQSRVMRYVMEGCEKGPVFQRDVERAFAMSRSTATGILQLLEKNGVLRRESVPEDARLKSLVPTERAAQMHARVQECIRENEALMTKGLSPGQLLLFTEVLAQMSANLDELPEETNESLFHNKLNAYSYPGEDGSHDKNTGQKHP